jgi:DNA mismatch repair ATPase MutS
MSGKSTLLRTVGINLVLAYAGAPVCASVFRCPVMDIYTSMRTSDKLEEGISSFYAELLRVKMIIEAARSGKPLLFLLDEIFKGTNSMDRHTGASMLIKKLSGFGAMGLVSTHDLELAELEKNSGSRIMNYHFQEYYENNEIHFDYKLRPGVSNTRNAIYLMKMAGIEFGNEDV